MDNVAVRAGFPAEPNTDVLSLLRSAVKTETEENTVIYPAFAQKATEEGLPDIARRFELIAAIEKTHADRLRLFAELTEQGKLFRSDGSLQWVCLNCGHLLTAREAPGICPVCSHEQGYFVRAELAPFA